MPRKKRLLHFFGKKESYIVSLISVVLMGGSLMTFFVGKAIDAHLMQTRVILPTGYIDPNLKNLSLNACISKLHKKKEKTTSDCFMRYIPDEAKGFTKTQAATLLSEIANSLEQRKTTKEDFTKIDDILKRTTAILKKFPAQGMKIIRKLHEILVKGGTERAAAVPEKPALTPVLPPSAAPARALFAEGPSAVQDPVATVRAV